MYYLRIGARFYRVVVSFIFVEHEGFGEREIVPISSITVPWQRFDTPRIVIDISIFGVAACACAGVGVELTDCDVVGRHDCAVVGAGDAWVVAFACIEYLFFAKRRNHGK